MTQHTEIEAASIYQTRPAASFSRASIIRFSRSLQFCVVSRACIDPRYPGRANLPRDIIVLSPWRSCTEFNHCAATIDLSRDTIEGGENGNYARGYICSSPSFSSFLSSPPPSWLGGSSNDPSTMMYESYTFFVHDIRDVTLDSIAWN